MFRSLDLPGSNKFAQQQASGIAGSSAANSGPYGGIAPTLAGANAGYAAGGPGANPTWRPWVPSAPSGGIFGFSNAVQAPFTQAGMGIGNAVGNAATKATGQ